MDNNAYVAYLRVSTQRQGVSGLGLQAQQEIIRNYLSGEEPIAEFVEIESGRKTQRPKLHEALELCKKMKATLTDRRQNGSTIKKRDLYEPAFGFGHRNRIL